LPFSRNSIFGLLIVQTLQIVDKPLPFQRHSFIDHRSISINRRRQRPLLAIQLSVDNFFRGIIKMRKEDSTDQQTDGQQSQNASEEQSFAR
ncbi:MAG: hypothetical protein C5B54_11685, partial [Acidobacteria bacterium]